MKPWTPTEAQIAQLALLKAKEAFAEGSAVSAKAYGSRNCPGINGVMLSIALVPKNLVGVVKKRASYGDPAMTLYWITDDGLRVLDRAEQPRAYDPAGDVAEQIP